MVIKGKVAAALTTVYIIWGSTYLAIRFAIETLPPFLMGGVRFFTAGIILYAIIMFKNGEKVTPEHWKTAIITGFSLLFIGNGCVMWAEQFVPSGLTSLIIAITPLWMVLIDWFRPGGIYPSHRIMTGIFIGLVGVGLLFGGDVLPNRYFNTLFGAGLLLFASLSWSAGSIYSRTAPRPKSPFMIGATQMIAGGLFLIILGLATGELSQLDGSHSLKSVMAMVYLVFFGSIIAYTAYNYLLHNATTATASTYAFVNPAVAVFLGWLLAGERLNFQTVAAASVIITGVFIIIMFRNNKNAG
jgi:drug/metabolite transporter (DMT)-like permease